MTDTNKLAEQYRRYHERGRTVAITMETVTDLQQLNDALLAVIERQREALDYYSNPENHAEQPAFRAPLSDRYLNQIQMNDRGKRANAALALSEPLAKLRVK